MDVDPLLERPRGSKGSWLDLSFSGESSGVTRGSAQVAASGVLNLTLQQSGFFFLESMEQILCNREGKAYVSCRRRLDFDLNRT